VTVIGTLVLGRDHDARDAGDIAFDAKPFGNDRDLPVLVCVDTDHASSGWLTLDDEAIATPSDFKQSVQRLELRGVVEHGSGRLAGVIAGKPGATIVVRVVADPGRARDASSGSSGASADAPHAAASAISRLQGTGGCGGPAGAASLAALALLLAVRHRRR
jgi:hypothetical protein